MTIETEDNQGHKVTINGRIIGVDFGLKKVGIAISDTVSLQAQPLEVLRISKNNTPTSLVKQLVKKWKPSAIVVGLPLAVNKEKQWITVKVEDFIEELSQLVDIPIFISDERYTSKIAKQLNQEHLFKKINQPMDDLAAFIILQAWLNKVVSQQ